MKKILAIVMAALCGCAPTSRKDPSTEGPESQGLGIRDAYIEGTIGPAELADVAQPSIYDDGWYLSVESVVTMPDRAAMTLLMVSGGTDLVSPGLDETFTLEDGRVTLLGCVGQESGIYDEYDLPADELDLQVDGESEFEMDVSATARWFDRGPDGQRLMTFREAETTFTMTR